MARRNRIPSRPGWSFDSPSRSWYGMSISTIFVVSLRMARAAHGGGEMKALREGQQGREAGPPQHAHATRGIPKGRRRQQRQHRSKEPVSQTAESGHLAVHVQTTAECDVRIVDLQRIDQL